VTQPVADIRRTIPEVAVEATWFAPDGHELRRIDWPGRNGGWRGSLLFLAGRADAYEKYLETLHGFHEQDWRVTAIDWRGQAGSGRLGNDPLTGHIPDFGLWIADLRAFWSGWRQEGSGPHVVIGHSMGGHLTLRAIEEVAIDPAAAVLVAPMLGFSGPPVPLALVQRFARLRGRLGDPRRAAWKWSEKPGEFPAGRKELLTHSDARYSDEEFWRKRRPELVMGPGSWGWVEQAAISMRRITAPGALARVDVPILIVATRADRLVSPRAIRRVARLLPDSRLLEFGGEAAHEILREIDPVRGRALTAITSFFNEKAPA